jgi:hypothetical protein
MNIIQINKFSNLHDGEKIIFCKTDFLFEEFEKIKKIKNDVILISGNSDYCISDKIVARAPQNIKKWFCQNRHSESFILQSIPLGLENTVECKVPGHGFVWDHAHEKHDILSNFSEKKSKDFVYANFNVNTNFHHRIALKEKSIESDHITWGEPNAAYRDYVNSILNHEAVLCAQGNDYGDNHRIYETLYLSRAAITFNTFQYKYLHYLFPTVLVTKLEQLDDIDNLKRRVDKSRKHMNTKYLDFEYWKDMILDSAKDL